MAVFRNVMAFLGLDDDDQMYDDEEGFIEEEAEEPSRTTGRGGFGRSGRSAEPKTISLDERFPGESVQPTFGFSTETGGEAGGVGAVRPLRPVPNAALIDVPEALSAPQTSGTDDGGVFPDGSSEESAARQADAVSYGAEASPSDSPQGVGAAEDQVQRRRSSVDTRGAFEGGGLASPADVLREPPRDADPTPQRHDRPVSSPPNLQPVEENEPPVVTHAKPRLHIPSSFDDASRIADDFRTGSPVVMNLTKVDKPVARRLVDFASGVCYVLAGGMERLAPNVYLLTPTGVGVSSEDRRRMQERGFDR